MNLAQSKITAQGQVSIPVAVMQQFGLAPGQVIEWDDQDGRLVVHRAGKYSLEDVCTALRIPQGAHKTDEEIRESLKSRVKAKHARS
jgi:bifunctional DNA-binding transcriptional regulator/antitoxin component of YhaV-PrlF toxin-antitoxin module